MRPFYFICLLILSLVPVRPGYSQEQPAKTEKSTPIRIAVYVGSGTGRSKEDAIKALKQGANIRVTRISAQQIRSGQLMSFDVVVFPGGSGGRQGKSLGTEGRQQVRSFVKSGGGYVGICAAAYLATCDYSWSLGVLDAKVIDKKHWARGYGPVELGLSETGKKLFHNNSGKQTIYYHQGPLLAPAKNPNIPDYVHAAKFVGEIARNGAPRGVMPGTTAVALGKFGKGRVVCFSPHPEKTEGLQHWLRDGVYWLRNGSPSVR